MTDRPDLSGELAAVVEEIRADAQAKRDSGEYPAGLERELDALFEDLVPERLNEHDFEAVLDRAERASLIDLHAPIDDRRRVYAQVKKGVQKLVLWYMEYVVRQLATFAANTTRAVRLLGNRVEAIEERHDALARRFPDVAGDLDADLVGLAPRPVGDWADALCLALGGVEGRVLHAEAGDGSIVRRLVELGVDAYGVDPVAAEDAPLLRREASLDHLPLVESAALAGLVLSGSVDRLPPVSKMALVEAAADVLGPGGRLVLVSMLPDAWDAEVPPPLTDLGGGRPFHPDTWRVLLGRCGFEAVEVQHGPPAGPPSSFMVTAQRPT